MVVTTRSFNCEDMSLILRSVASAWRPRLSLSRLARSRSSAVRAVCDLRSASCCCLRKFSRSLRAFAIVCEYELAACADFTKELTTGCAALPKPAIAFFAAASKSSISAIVFAHKYRYINIFIGIIYVKSTS